MNRYRRSAQKTSNEAPLNSDDRIYFISNSETVPKKPNIISRKSVVAKNLDKHNQGQTVSLQEKQSQSDQPQGTKLPINAVPPDRAVETSEPHENSNEYYMLGDGTVAPDDCPGVLHSANQPLDTSQRIVSENNLNELSQSTLRSFPTTAISQPQALQSQNSGDQEEGLPSDLPRLLQQPQQKIQGGTKELIAAGDLRGDFLNEKTQKGVDKLVSGASIEQPEENQEDNQYVILQWGSKTLLVPVASFQKYCDAQQSGDVQSTTEFLNQIEQAMSNSSEEAVAGTETAKPPNSENSSIETGSNAEVTHLKEPSITVDTNGSLKSEENGSLLDTESNVTEKIDIPKSDVESPKSTACPKNECNDDITSDEPLSKKLKEDSSANINSDKILPTTAHNQSSKKENINIFRCGTCTMLFSTKELCMQHIYVVHKADPLKTQCDLRRTNETRFICHGCSRTFGNIGDFQQHNLSSHGTDTSYVRDSSASSNSTLVPKKISDQSTQKNEEMHTKPKKSESIVCNQEVKNSMNLKYPVSFDCSKCSKKVVNLYYYLLHGLTHVKVGDGWVCQICSENFKTKPSLKEHFRIHCELKSPDSDPNGQFNGSIDDNIQKTPDNLDVAAVPSSSKTVQSAHVDEHGNNENNEELKKTESVVTRRGRRKNLHLRDRRFSDTPCIDSNHNSNECSPSGTIATNITPVVNHTDSQTSQMALVAVTKPDRSRLIDDVHSTERKLLSARSEGKNESNNFVVPSESATVSNEVVDEGVGTSLANPENLSSSVPIAAEDQTPVKTTKEDGHQVKKRVRVSRTWTKTRHSIRRIDNNPSRFVSPDTTKMKITKSQNFSVVLDSQQQKEQVGVTSLSDPPTRRQTRGTTIANTVSSEKGRTRTSGGDVKESVVKCAKPARRIQRTSSKSMITPAEKNYKTEKEGPSKSKLSSTKMLRSSKKDEPDQTSFKSNESVGEKKKRGRKSDTVPRELLPEDGPKFEAISAKPVISRKKQAKYKVEQLANPESRCRVQQSFMDIFKKVKGTNDSIKEGSNIK